ncbi:hypothetical protein LX15_006105 [Streptoalloteichus tenebrarius]|uniref:Uncharacterized protein n=1 Tax=Streptoalloteichus tenebrarius (strain ATCC 17920 / DSM 40477 / JCM 4838 / CBS 697.72 / NBRC 16177 / NCIMB 11028 / NRRL B-12390 / A12253. 1 / ISP 5477) TaxID=1933 RepID=A0ABT1I3P2_STRSD|nr:hypothetical protein [Streptoalloteichus tenebrarius]MCP2262369.1 hypothetical protein [Streptoalloteichus tenebrarius]BFF00630.1 hypothetical protein GCM10020241_23050 [Streptoalloteichus tenebrarius]
MGTREPRCERCDLPIGQCEHTRRASAPGRSPDVLLVSPTGTAHLPGGCAHKDDPDYSRWGEIRHVPQAWERLGNQEPIPVNGGANRQLVARVRCKDCERH